MKKCLIIGGGYADIPLILSAKKLGYHVLTTNNRPADPGHAYADCYYKEDYSDKEAIYRLAHDLNLSAICPGCNDFAALSAAYSAEKLGLPGHDPYETAEIIHHKDKYRKFALENNISSPKAIGCQSIEDVGNALDKLSFPLIIKPVDLTGGKGISVGISKAGILNAAEKAFAISKAKRLVVEEFIEGSRHGFSAFIYKKKVCFYFSDNEHYFLNPYMVSGASSPSIVSEKVEQNLCRELENIAHLLNLKDGILHTQFILRNDQPFIIEICRRAPGDLYIKLVEYATGVDYANWIIKSSAGIDCGEFSHAKPTGFYLRHCVMCDNVGTLKDLIIKDNIKNNIVDKYIWWEKGEIISDIMTAKLGIIFFKFHDYEEMQTKTDLIYDYVKAVVA
jgi:biotin carboxylase